MTTTAIPTRYRGIRFRSKLEADWALAFDRLGVEWVYEQEGLQLEHVFYLPDFHLPRSRQYVEVKGLPTPDDVRKWRDLVAHLSVRPFTSAHAPDIPLVICQPHGAFFGYPRTRPDVRFDDFVLDHATPVALLQCARCGGWWFAAPDGSFRCQCCGAYEGRQHVADFVDSPARGWPRAIRELPF